MVSVAYAQAGGSAAGSLLESLPFLVLMVAIFYFLLIRPEQRKRRDHQTMLAGLKRNDRVTMASGLHGRIVALGDTVVTVEIAPKVQVDFDRSAIERVHVPEAREKERSKP